MYILIKIDLKGCFHYESRVLVLDGVVEHAGIGASCFVSYNLIGSSPIYGRFLILNNVVINYNLQNLSAYRLVLLFTDKTFLQIVMFELY